MKVTIKASPRELAELVLHLGGPVPTTDLEEPPVLGYPEPADPPKVVRPEDMLRRIPDSPEVQRARAAGRAAVMPPEDP